MQERRKDALDRLILKHSIPLVSDSSLSKHPTNSSGCAGTTSREEWASVSKLGMKRQSLWSYCACKKFQWGESLQEKVQRLSFHWIRELNLNISSS